MSRITTGEIIDYGNSDTFRNVIYSNNTSESYEEKWMELKKWVEKYKMTHTPSNNWDAYGRYCVAISCDDILQRMNELDQNFMAKS